jgi:hypothetical protein
MKEVSEQVKAWGFAVNLLRQKEEARVVTAAGQIREIAPDVDLEVVVATPDTPAQEKAYEEGPAGVSFAGGQHPRAG